MFTERDVQATLDYAPLSQVTSILGLTCFDDREVQIWNEDHAKPIRRKGYPRMIKLDPDVWAERGCQSGRFTVAHEVAHILLHEVVDLEEGCTSAKLTDETTPNVMVDDVERARLQPPNYWLEWQANRFGACLLMPWNRVKEALPTFAEQINGRAHD